MAPASAAPAPVASKSGTNRTVPRGADPCYVYEPGHVDAATRAEIVAWLGTLRPLWEMRYSMRRPPPPGRQQKPLLRPVYWLGNWQFACLGYYEPPRRSRDVAVAAEPFPPVLARLVAQIERRVRAGFPRPAVPRAWHLNTCLVNFYGDRKLDGKVVDAARVGEHRDHEPGPVASISLGERARFQFVRRGARDAPPVRTQWLEDGSLQIFGGPHWKDDLLHRVQRVDDKLDLDFPPAIAGFRTRRVNFTFRYVPDEHVTPFAALSPAARDDVRDYMRTLAEGSPFFAAALVSEGRTAAAR
ncbi:MAG: alpha-ketoglutarate-dependent dioxygenase AlkB [Deltaproteobacteria bacterium]|nr:alpha-ketoglutarate-dependent dioxygenase AlkB [Deltaproteobacteria bacterium]